MRRKKYKKCLWCSIFLAMVIIIVSGILYINNDLPDTIFVNSNESTRYDFSIPVSVDVTDKEKITITGKNKIDSGEKGHYKGKYKLFGLIPVKKANVKVVDKTYAYPIGIPVGLYLKTQGVMIIDAGEFEDENGKSVSPASGIVNEGEYITAFNDIQVSNKSQLTYLINENGEKEVKLTIKGENAVRQVKITPKKNSDGEYMLGIWVRDDSQGIGTLSFVTENGKFTALGHGISDIDTGKLLSSNDGSIYKANIWGIRKGKEGKPGGLCGTIAYNDENKIGTIESNSNSGLFGEIDKNIWQQYNIDKMEVALHSEIKKGKAQIQFVMDGKLEKYDIEIKEINKNIKEKNMIIEITDKKLLNMTNGIVQGMSGSPIIQDGKIIGAVTHVMVNDPHKGYGIFAENMLMY